MKIKRTDAVAMLVDLGFPSAADWDDAKLLKKIQLVPTKVSESDVKAQFQPLLNELIAADGDIQLADEAPEEEEVDEVIDVDSMDKAAIRAFIEERKLDIKIRAKDSIADVKAKLKKLLAKTPARKVKKSKPAKAKKAGAKSTVEKDKYGCRLGTIRAQTNTAFSRAWKTIAQIEEESGVPPGKINGNLADQVKSGLLEVRKENGKNEYRLAK
jgi:hypothetical protein